MSRTSRFRKTVRSRAAQADTPAPRRFESLLWRRAVEILRVDGRTRVALYGAGRHTRRFLAEWRGADSPAFVLVLDDRTEEGDLDGCPVRRPADLAPGEVDAVLISSDSIEDELWNAAAPLRERGVPVYRIYGGADAGGGATGDGEHDSYESIFESIRRASPEAYHVRDGLYEENARIYHAYNRRQIHDRLFDRLGAHVRPDARILDVGSGRGYDTHRMAKRFPQASITGMEYAPMGVRLSERYAGPRLSFVQGDATAMPFDDGSFDAAYSVATIEHVAGQEAMAREIFRVLAPGGYLVIATHPLEYWMYWCEDQARKLEAVGRKFDFHGMEVERLAALLEGAGFEPVETGFAGFVFPQRWLKYLQHLDPRRVPEPGHRPSSFRELRAEEYAWLFEEIGVDPKDAGFTGFLLPRRLSLAVPGLDFRLFFAFQALAGWVFRDAGQEKRLYYQYHLVRKPGNEPAMRQISGERSRPRSAFRRAVAASLYPVVERRFRALRDRCAALD